LPVLGPQGFVTRIDCKADRSSGVLQLLQRLDEPGPKINEDQLSQALTSFAVFNGCQRWQAA